MNTKYLVTGAAGNLGSNIIQKLLAAGAHVRALVLNGDPAEKLLPEQTEIVRGDVLDLQSLDRFFAVDESTRVIVIHAASIVALRPEFNQKVYDVNVIGTQNIVAKCVENRVAKLVYISSTGAIPELPKGQAIREVDRLDSGRVRGCYAQSKAEATAYVLEEGKKQGLDVSVLYPSGILGPNDYSYGLFSKFAISYASGKLPVGVQGSFNVVDVRDLADCVIACTQKGRPGEGYIIANKTVTFREMIALFQRYCNGRKVRVFVPLWLADVGVFFIGLWGKIVHRPSWLTPFTIYNLRRNNDYNCDKAKAELGVHIRPFEETIRDTVLWLESVGKIKIAPAKPQRRDPSGR